MQRQRLGRTGLMVSPAGLGCGGYSRLGMARGATAKEAQAIVSHARDLGINFFDTARAYGTEEVVGKAVEGYRDDVVISTKTLYLDRDGEYLAPEVIVESLEKSLVRLKSDYVDVFSLHGVTTRHLDHCLEVIVPALQQQVSLGKIRHIGVTESFMQDTTHEMLKQAIPSGAFDVVMVGFNFLNAGARESVFRLAREHDVGTQVMHAVRKALADSAILAETVSRLIKAGEIDPAMVNRNDPLDFLQQYPDVSSVTEAAYRYCRHEPGVSVVLTGTGSTRHLSQNAEAIQSPPLPDELFERLNAAFGGVTTASGD